MASKFYLSYEDYGKEISKLSQNVLGFQSTRRIPYTHIYGSPRGGLPIAIHLSHNLCKNMIYDVDKFNNLIQHEYNTYPTRLLICDDLIDSGETIKDIVSKIDLTKIIIDIAVLFIKPRSSKILEELKNNRINIINTNEAPDDQWIVFPWEHPDGFVDKKYMD